MRDRLDNLLDEASRRDLSADMRRIFEAHMATDGAKAELDELAALVNAGRPLCLLCFERHPDHCHRRILGEHLAARLGVEVVDLMP